ncbi:MAG: hypothetical protein KatS3mg052_0997 [Candidatus Roseilinea sp.]|nr:MAG: hypothetical protein KatS3mg052_0997 [Candidatus Roseilinea sp.]
MCRSLSHRLIPIIFIFAAGTLFGAPAHAQMLPLSLWDNFQPVTVDTRPALQSEPALAASSGGDAFVAWLDTRYALPDVHGAWIQDAKSPSEVRVAHLRPHFNVPALRTPAVSMDANNRAFVAWADDQRIYLVRSISSSAWTSPTVVVSFSSWEHTALQPALASDGTGNLVVAWTDLSQSDNHVRVGDIYARRCDGATTPIQCNSSPARVNDDNGARNPQRKPAIARQGDTVVLVWEDGRERGPDFPRIYASFSYDGGQSWSVNMRVNRQLDGSAPRPTDSATHPAVAIAPDGSVWVAWEHRTGSPTAQADIYLARWDGSAWSTPWRVDDAPPRVRSLAPSLAAANQAVFVAWQDYRNGPNNPDIYLARLDRATNQVQVAGIALPRPQRSPRLTRLANGQLYLVWQSEKIGGEANVFGMRVDGSSSLTFNDVPRQLNTDAPRLPYQMTPALTVHQGTPYLMFADRQYSYIDFYLVKQVNGSWATPQPLPTQAQEGIAVHHEAANVIAGPDGKLHLLWSDDHWTRGLRVRYATFDPQTQSWSEPIFLSRVISRTEMLPSLAIFSTTLAASWSRRDSATGQLQLFASWTDAGAWVTETAVLTQTFNAWNWPTSVATDGNNIYVAWHREEQSNGRGRIWLARKPLDPSSPWQYGQINPPHTDDWCYHREPRLATGRGRTAACRLGRMRTAQPPVALGRVITISTTLIRPTKAQPGAHPCALRSSLTISIATPARRSPYRPAGRVMIVYPYFATSETSQFAAAMIENHTVVFTRTLSHGSGWVRAGTYEGSYYGGDSAGSVAYDSQSNRFILAVVDRSNTAPRLWTTNFWVGATPPRVHSRRHAISHDHDSIVHPTRRSPYFGALGLEPVGLWATP